ncbi:protein of unknown function-containing protein [Forsythia ovata]|uniref:CFA20 domain-containing protein n=1 Tax=Forsythia ovata TaxID=205694 RepID=A0ABD1QPK2_9LAMI
MPCLLVLYLLLHIIFSLRYHHITSHTPIYLHPIPPTSHYPTTIPASYTEENPSFTNSITLAFPRQFFHTLSCSQHCPCPLPPLFPESTSFKVVEEMFKNTFQSGFLSILYSLGSKPLQIWDKEVVNGQIKRLQDEDIQSNVLEIVGSNVQSAFITCPADPNATLGIKLPFLVMIVKNLKKYFTFEIQVLDDKNVRRRFRASNFQVVTRVKPFICTMPLKLDEGWNQIQLNLTDLTRRAYGTNYVETLRVQVHPNCRLRRIYFSDRLYSEEELPPEFKLYLPMQQKI